jgi:Zn-dependent protease
VPGLDGYGVIRPFLPDASARSWRKVERVGFLILFALIFWVPGVSGLIFGRAALAIGLLGVPRAAPSARVGTPSISGAPSARPRPWRP